MLVFCLFYLVVVIVVLIFHFLILILALRGEGRKPHADLAALCLIFAFLRHFTVDFV
jgi:hypothetical protein